MTEPRAWRPDTPVVAADPPNRSPNMPPASLSLSKLPMRPDPGAQPNQSLIDGMATLQALATASEPMGCRELARVIGLDPTKVNRMLKTLAYLGIARQLSNRKYTAGAGMHVLAAQSLFASGLIRRALPVLDRLRTFGHTVAMGVLWNDNVSYLFHAPPGIDAARGLGRIGLLPASTSGIGTVLMSELHDDEVRRIYADKAVPGYAAGLEGPDGLLATLAVTRQRGFARVHVPDDRNHHVVAVTTGDPAHAGIALSGWIPDASTDDLVDALRSAALEVG
jgi:DNA-binding IclR family transcriptional regulator